MGPQELPQPTGQQVSPSGQPFFGQEGQRSGIPTGGSLFGGHRLSKSEKKMGINGGVLKIL